VYRWLEARQILRNTQDKSGKVKVDSERVDNLSDLQAIKFGKPNREAKKAEASFPAREVRKTASALASSYVADRPNQHRSRGRTGGSDSEDDRRLEARVKVIFDHDPPPPP
jgi:hypothetical protein